METSLGRQIPGREHEQAPGVPTGLLLPSTSTPRLSGLNIKTGRKNKSFFIVLWKHIFTVRVATQAAQQGCRVSSFKSHQDVGLGTLLQVVLWDLEVPPHLSKSENDISTGAEIPISWGIWQFPSMDTQSRHFGTREDVNLHYSSSPMGSLPTVTLQGPGENMK